MTRPRPRHPAGGLQELFPLPRELPLHLHKHVDEAERRVGVQQLGAELLREAGEQVEGLLASIKRAGGDGIEGGRKRLIWCA